MSFGIKVGRAIGTVGALAVEGAVRGATGLGRFGSDVVDGAEAGFNEKHAALLVTRKAAEERRKAFVEAKRAEHALAMVVATEPVVVPAPIAPAKTKATAKAAK